MLKILAFSLVGTLLSLPGMAMDEDVGVFYPEEGEPAIRATVVDVYLPSVIFESELPFVDLSDFSKPYGKTGIGNCESRFFFEKKDQTSFGDVFQDSRSNGSKVTILVEDKSTENITECYIRVVMPGKTTLPFEDEVVQE